MGRVITVAPVLAAAAALVACASADESAGRDEASSASEGGRPGSTRLATADLDDGREVVLRSRGPLQCLTIRGLDEYTRACGDASFDDRKRLTARPITANTVAQRDDSAPLEVYGATSPEVAAVILEHVGGGSQERTPAVLFRVTDEELLETAGFPGPFGYYVGELPPRTSTVRAIALDAEGARLGAVSRRFELLLRQAGPRQVFIEDLPADATE